MTIGIICAMNEEINLLQQDITAHHVTTIAGRDFHVGTLYGMSVVLVTGRIGKVAAGVTAALLIHHFQVDKIIFSGTAGGVNPDLNVGDAVVADKSVQHDFKLPWGDAFRIPLLEVSYMESDHELTTLAKQAVQDYIDTRMMQDIPQTYLDAFHIRNPKVVTGTIASGDEFVCTKEKNQWLYEHVDNIQCVEMEGAAVAQVCLEFSVPFTIIRIISDCANDDASVDFDLFIEEAACHFTKGVVKALLERLV